MATTETLNLQLTGVSEEDLNLSFLEWRQMINGVGCNSNMEIIDAAAKVVVGMLEMTIRTINGTAPDQNGNIELTAEDIGAAESDHTHDTATTSVAGFMSATDKSRVNTLYNRVDQSLTTTSSPTFASVTATGTITADKVIGAVYA